MKTKKRVCVPLRSVPQTFIDRVKKVRYGDDVSELLIDFMYFCVLAEVNKSAFVLYFGRTLFTILGDRSIYGKMMISDMIQRSFSLCVSCGAIQYTPRKPLLPGEVYE